MLFAVIYSPWKMFKDEHVNGICQGIPQMTIVCCTIICQTERITITKSFVCEIIRAGKTIRIARHLLGVPTHNKKRGGEKS